MSSFPRVLPQLSHVLSCVILMHKLVSLVYIPTCTPKSCVYCINTNLCTKIMNDNTHGNYNCTFGNDIYIVISETSICAPKSYIAIHMKMMVIYIKNHIN